MKRRASNVVTLIAVLGAGVVVAATAASQTQGGGRSPWGRCCGVPPWPQPPGAGGPGMTGRGMMGGGMMGGGMARHHLSMMSGVPAPYTGLTNPLPRTRATLDRGAAVYADNCASCHGTTGLGDGPAARDLTPPPANLAWLSSMPMARWDAYMFWTVSEGGAPIGSAMPAFKDTLSETDRWAVIAYIQARMPPNSGR